MNPESAILLVEDNPDDVFFMERALKAAAITNRLQVAKTGEEAVSYMAGEGQYSDRVEFPCPCLVFLDLKLPGKTGLEVLGWLREQKVFSNVIVIALTTSREPRDISEAYRLGANAYLVKPTSPSQLQRMMVAVRDFWITHAIVE